MEKVKEPKRGGQVIIGAHTLSGSGGSVLVYQTAFDPNALTLSDGLANVILESAENHKSQLVHDMLTKLISDQRGDLTNPT